MAAPRIPGWQQTVLQGVGAPITPENILFLNDWTRAEGGGAENNPFNTTQPGYHEIGDYNSVHVKRYGDPNSGLQATIHTLMNGRYGNILSALKQGKSAVADAQALANSPWGTGALVLKMLGAHTTPGPGGGVTSRDLASQAVSGAPVAPQGPDPRQALLGMLSNNLSAYANTGQMGTQMIDPSSFLQAQASQPMTPAPSKSSVTRQVNLRGSLPALGGNARLTTIPGTGYQANAQILPQVESISKMFGVRVNSAYRSPEHNREVGGATHSDHLSGNAIDFVGTPEQMRKLYTWAQGKFPYVEPWGQAGGNHVHISFIR